MDQRENTTGWTDPRWNPETGTTSTTSATSATSAHTQPGAGTYAGSMARSAATERDADQGLSARASDVADQVQERASDLADQAKEQVNSRLTDQIDRASTGLHSLADAVFAVERQLHDQNQPQMARLAHQAGQRVQRMSLTLAGKDLDDLVDQAEDFARRSPAAFIGAAFGLGFLATRFLKSSGRRERQEREAWRTQGTMAGTYYRGRTGGTEDTSARTWPTSHAA